MYSFVKKKGKKHPDTEPKCGEYNVLFLMLMNGSDSRLEDSDLISVSQNLMNFSPREHFEHHGDGRAFDSERLKGP